MEQPLISDSNAQYVDDIKKSFSLLQQSLRWCFSVLCVALLLASFRIYQDKGNLTSTQVRNFNAITTVLPLLLGLSFFDAFKDLANVARWSILSATRWTELEKRLIRDITKATVVIELLLTFRPKPLLALTCLLWIAINLGAQTAVALITQTYSLPPGTNWKGTYIRGDQVNAANLTCYYHHIYDDKRYICDQSDETVHGIAHLYGEYAFGSLSEDNNCVNYTTIEDVLRSETNPKYYCRRTPGRQEFAYRFLEYNPRDDQRTYPFPTNRTITASAGECYNYSLSSLEEGCQKGEKWSNYTYSNQTFSGSILLPVQIETFDGTVYIYRGFKPPQTATDYACGPRCIWMWAHKTIGPRDSSMFYQCPVTVQLVQNSYLDVHHVPNDIARLAASSIGLQGGKSDPENGLTQFQFYPISSPWDVHGQPTDKVGANMAEFALGSIATMASNNPAILIPGHLPTLGSRLEVTWAFAIGLLISIAGVHSVLTAAAIFADRWNRANLLTGD